MTQAELETLHDPAEMLVCSVVDSRKHRTHWRNHTPTETPLPGLPDFGQAPSVSFLMVTAMASTSLPSSRRIAVLSRTGVNLLMQRWIYHNSRVIVPTITIDEAVAARHEEAGLCSGGHMECYTGEWCNELACSRNDPDS